MPERLIEKTAQNGQPICLVGGVHLCSSFNPDREASRWADRHSDLLTSAPVVLLGLGCGYHALEIASRTEQKVIVFEKRPELITWFYRNSKRQFPHLQIYRLGDDGGKTMDRIYGLMGKAYTVLTNPYSFKLDEVAYSELQDLLLGRSPNGFRGQLEHRPDLKRFFKEEEISHPGDRQLMGFSLVKEALATSENHSKEAEIWRTLGELVK